MDGPTNASVITTEYFLTGVTHALLKSFNSREVTAVASTFSLITLMSIGCCILCISKFMRKRKKLETVSPIESDTSSHSPPDALFEGWKSSSKGSEPMEVKSKMENFNGKRKLMVHTNIITPDRHIEFVVPTVRIRLLTVKCMELSKEKLFS